MRSFECFLMCLFQVAMEVMDMGTVLTLAIVSTSPFHHGFIDLPFSLPFGTFN